MRSALRGREWVRILQLQRGQQVLLPRVHDVQGLPGRLRGRWVRLLRACACWVLAFTVATTGFKATTLTACGAVAAPTALAQPAGSVTAPTLPAPAALAVPSRAFTAPALATAAQATAARAASPDAAAASFPASSKEPAGHTAGSAAGTPSASESASGAPRALAPPTALAQASGPVDASAILTSPPLA